MCRCKRFRKGLQEAITASWRGSKLNTVVAVAAVSDPSQVGFCELHILVAVAAAVHTAAVVVIVVAVADKCTAHAAFDLAS